MLNVDFLVDSNDSLYAGDPKFVGKVAELLNTLIDQILEHLKTLANPEEVNTVILQYYPSGSFMYTLIKFALLFIQTLCLTEL